MLVNFPIRQVGHILLMSIVTEQRLQVCGTWALSLAPWALSLEPWALSQVGQWRAMSPIWHFAKSARVYPQILSGVLVFCQHLWDVLFLLFLPPPFPTAV